LNSARLACTRSIQNVRLDSSTLSACHTLPGQIRCWIRCSSGSAIGMGRSLRARRLLVSKCQVGASLPRGVHCARWEDPDSRHEFLQQWESSLEASHISHLAGGRQPKVVSCHAEMAALNRLPESVTARCLRQCTLVVIRPSYNRETRQTKLLCSRPCKECATVVCRLGIKAVMYSDGDQLVRQTPQEILSVACPTWATKELVCSATGRVGDS